MRWLWLLLWVMVVGCKDICDYVPEYCKDTVVTTETGDVETDVDTDTDADSDADTDSDTSLPVTTGDTASTDTSSVSTGDTGGCEPEVFGLVDGVHTAVVNCTPNLLDPATAFTVPSSDPDPGTGLWVVRSTHGWTVTDLGPSPVNWPTIGDFWSMAVLTGTLPADGGVLTDECVEVDLVVDPARAYAVDLTARSTTQIDNVVALLIDDVEIARVVVPQNEPELFVGFGFFQGSTRVNLKICSGTLQGGVNLAQIRIREAIITQ